MADEDEVRFIGRCLLALTSAISFLLLIRGGVNESRFMIT
jgi:hypothetical protein